MTQDPEPTTDDSRHTPQDLRDQDPEVAELIEAEEKR
jgi:hypothetical protein